MSIDDIIFLILAICAAVTLLLLVERIAQCWEEHRDTCENCHRRHMRRMERRARRRPPSSRAVELFPEPAVRPQSPVDAAAAKPAAFTGPNPGGRSDLRPRPTTRPQRWRHG